MTIPLSIPPADGDAIVNPSRTATTQMRQWMRSLRRVLSAGIDVNFAVPGNGVLNVVNGIITGTTATATGITATVTLAKLTSGGSNGSMQVINGIITSYTAPS